MTELISKFSKVLLIALLLVFCHILTAREMTPNTFTNDEEECVCPTIISIRNQSELDQFVVDCAGVSSVFDQITIREVNDISGLSFITAVYNLRIESSLGYSLSPGLSNLQTVSELSLADFIDLNLNGLSSLTPTTLGILHLQRAPNLQTLQKLNTLTTVDWLVLSSIPNLPNLQGLNSLTSANSLALSINSGLSDLQGLNSLSSVGSMNISLNYNLQSLNGLNLGSIAETLLIRGNSILTDITALSLSGSFETFVLLDNPSIQSLQGLNSVASLESLSLSNNNNLTNISALSGLTSLKNLAINDNALLSNLSPLSQIDPYELNSLYLRNNSSLNSIFGIQHIRSLNTLHIEESNFIDFNFPDLEIIGDNCSLIGNPNLSNIDGLSHIKFIGGILEIRDNPLLNNCCVLPAIYPAKVNKLELSENGVNCSDFVATFNLCLSTDIDQDGVISSLDNCLNDNNPNQEDTDGDGVGNACDNCPLISNIWQEDSDNNFIGDACENLSASNARVDAYEVVIRDSHRGLILKNEQEKCYKLYVDVDGTLRTQLITCPN